MTSFISAIPKEDEDLTKLTDSEIFEDLVKGENNDTSLKILSNRR